MREAEHPKSGLWDNPEGWGGEGITHMEHNPDGTRSSNSCFSVWGYVQNKHNLESQASKNLAIFSTKEELHSPLENKIELLKIFPDDPHLLLPKGVFSSLTASAEGVEGAGMFSTDSVQIFQDFKLAGLRIGPGTPQELVASRTAVRHLPVL